MASRHRNRSRFIGEICGFGTESGDRMVVGRWASSPLGAFADVMHESADGVRTLLAPNESVARFVQETYSFDRVEIVAVATERSAGRLQLEAGRLSAVIEIGPRTLTGRVLRCVPASIARAPWWCTVIDPMARLVLRGVRTRGTAGHGRREWYGATDQHSLRELRCTLDGRDLGELADVWPPVRFGFSSTPRRPSIVAVTTTIDEVLKPMA